MTRIIIRTDPLDHSKDLIYQALCVGDFLYGYFKRWPATAVLYQDDPGLGREIPIKTKEDVSKLNKLEGTVYVVIYPESAFAVVGLALIGATAAIGLSSKSKESPGNTANERQQPEEQAPNNSLSPRSNRARIGQRIPDIFGTVRSTPDLIAQPYRFFDQRGKEAEHSFMCIGRGSYDVDDIRQSETQARSLGKNSVEIYGPGTSPNNSAPMYSEGTITEEFINTTRVETVSDDTLIAPNVPEYNETTKILHLGSAVNRLDSGSNDYDLRDYFTAGGTIELKNGETGYIYTIDSYNLTGYTYIPYTGTFVDNFQLDGTYTIDEVHEDYLTLEDPHLVNSDWNIVNTHMPNRYPGWIVTMGTPPAGFVSFSNGSSYNNTNILADTTEYGESRTVGPVIIEDADEVMINFVAPNGLYDEQNTVDTSSNPELQVQTNALNIDIDITYQQVDINDTPVGSPYVETVTISGSADTKQQFGYTHRAKNIPFSGRMEITIERTSDTFNDGVNQVTVQDEINVQDIYGVKAITKQHFGDVTTARVVSFAGRNDGNRRFNLKASRLIPTRVSGETFTAPQASSDAADIIVAMATDPRIGNLSLSDLDLDSIYDNKDAVGTYFGTQKAEEFNYTFDDNNLSFEESLAIVADCIFCNAYRQGEKIKLFFEQPQTSSKLLFNHRNKIPGSETRTIGFSTPDEHDGVELEYVNSEDGKPEIVYAPIDSDGEPTAINPDKIKQAGVINRVQAHLHAYRYLNRLLYQNTIVEFDAMKEATLLIRNERILIADNTRPNTCDGEVVMQAGTLLTLSQDFEFEDGKEYTIFLQNVDGSVESIGISAGPMPGQIILDSAPALPLSVDNDNYAKSTYEIVENSSDRKRAFLVDEKSPRGGLVVGLTASNYDERYYQNDTDFTRGYVTEDGERTDGVYSVHMPDAGIPSYWRFLSLPAERSNVTIEFEMATTDVSGWVLLADSTDVNKFIGAAKQYDFNTQVSSGAGSPIIKTNGVVAVPGTRHAMFNAVANGSWQKITLENVDLTGWSNIGNFYLVAGWYYGGKMRNWKIDWNSNGIWDNYAYHASGDGFSIHGASTFEKD